MSGRMAGSLCILCAMLAGVLISSHAQAAETGTTAVTCKAAAAEAQFSDAHCKTSQAGGEGFKHESIANGKATATAISNETTGGASEPTKLKATISGIPMELVATGVSGTGSIENKLVGEEHVSHGTSSLTLTGITVAKPAEKGCAVVEDTKTGEKGTKGAIKAKELTSTTAGQGMGVQFTPVEGTVLATFWIEGCTGATAALNKTYKLEGAVVGTPEGATVKFTHGTKEPKVGTTGQATMRLNETITPGIEGSFTTKAEGTPLAFTTTS